MSGARLSVVIPALDEAAHIAAAIASVGAADEIVVVDGGSRDGTPELASAAGAQVLISAPGRGRQLALGAQAATGVWLVFLHADTRLDPGWAEALRRLPADVVGGAFRFTLDPPRRAHRVIEFGVDLRARGLGLPYGDQALFARRTTYQELGGFRPLPLMEDVDFVRRLGRAGRLAFPAVRAHTSARRFQQRGLLGTTLLNWSLLALYAAGWPATRLAQLYGRRA